MQPGIWQLLIVAALVLILFGRGRISDMMGDFGKGIKSFKEGIRDENTGETARPLVDSAKKSTATEAASTTEVSDKS